MPENPTNLVDQITAGQTAARKAVVTDANNKVHGHQITSTIGLVQAQVAKFTENGAGTYTASFSIPAGSILIDIIVVAEALWTAATSAALTIGDGDDADGFFASTDLKATDLLAGESASLGEKDGGLLGAYNAGTSTHITNRYDADARTISAVVTSVGAGTAGRTRVVVLYTLADQEVAVTQ